MTDRLTNAEVADLLDEVATLLEAQDAGPFRVRAWRRGADEVRGLDRPVDEILEAEGRGGLEALPAIGPTLARAIDQIVHRGRFGMLDRLRGEVAPEDLLTTVPGIGRVLAHRLHEELGVETLQGLEVAAHDGRLERVAGVGRRRAAAIRDVLATRLRTRRPPSRPPAARGAGGPGQGGPGTSTPAQGGPGTISSPPGGSGGPGRGEPGAPVEPPASLLLEVDRIYRERAAAGALKRIAPKRFNPKGEAWLPILHTEVEGWHVTALFSNTALAHRLGRTHDWVVLYYERDGHEGQCTVVDGPHGRVIRGREAESAPEVRSA